MMLASSPLLSGLLQTPNFSNLEFGNFFSDESDLPRATPHGYMASPRSTRSQTAFHGALSPSTFLKSPAVGAQMSDTPSTRRTAQTAAAMRQQQGEVVSGVCLVSFV